MSGQQRHQEPIDVYLLLRRDTEAGAEVLLSRRAGDVYASGLWHLVSGHLDGPREQGERQFAPWVAQGGNVEEIHQALRNLRYAKAHRRHRPLLDILTTLANHMESAVDADEFDTSAREEGPLQTVVLSLSAS